MGSQPAPLHRGDPLKRASLLHAVNLLLILAATARPDDSTALFEAKIRPVLIDKCYACHSADAKRIKGGLRLDTREAMLAGGDSGPTLTPGNADESLLIAALRHEGPEMPPSGRLTETVIADFVRWIEQGAPDPRGEEATSEPSRPSIDIDAGRAFWAYQPPKPTLPSAVENESWPLNPIDSYLLGPIESHHHSPAPEADRATLARRLSFDLTGLPPPPSEIEDFRADDRPDAYERLVDRLLASPAFGERWGRHWLDLARFGESLTLRGFVLPSAWRYRDEVIRAYNDDRPFDAFIRQQVAGDLLPAHDLNQRRSNLVSTMFLTLGNSNLEEQDKLQLEFDIIDEQIDVIGRAVLAQTIACARCHDHKFDPIPTADYYALAGILRDSRSIEHANVSKWIERPLPDTPNREAEFEKARERITALESMIASARAEDGGSPVLAPSAIDGIVVDDEQARAVGPWTRSTHSGRYINAGYSHDANTDKGEKSLTFQPDLPTVGRYEVRLAYSPDSNRATNVPITLLTADGETTLRVNQRLDPPIARRFVSLGTHRFEAGNQYFVRINTEGTDGHVVADAVVFHPESAAEPGPESRTPTDLAALEADLKALRGTAPRPDSYIGLIPAPEIRDEPVRIRGDAHSQGPVAPRGFLRVIDTPRSVAPNPDQNGRFALAAWLTDPDNPLTARVYVNRVWSHLFGRGLVATVDNFGVTGEPSSHPELLDHLALRFVDQGSSTKSLIRDLVTTRAYRQSSLLDASAIEADPENRFLARVTRRRLEAECLRDAILAASGDLDRRMEGPSFPADLAADYGFATEENRRSVYLPVFRNALPPLFLAFDFADPSVPNGRRDMSTVAPQALFLANAPFVHQQSLRCALRLKAEVAEGDRLAHAFRATLGREPTPGEERSADSFLGDEPDQARWAELFQALFATPDFRSLD